MRNVLPPELINQLADLGVDPDQLFSNFGEKFSAAVRMRSLESSSSLTALQDRIDAERQLDATNSVASQLGVEVSSVSEILERLMVESRQRIVRRLLAISVPDTLMDMIQDSLRSMPLPNVGAAGLYMLQAEVGSGKSTIAERLHQSDIEAAMENALAPLPLFLEARKIRITIEADLRQVWGSNVVGPRRQISLVIDGLDEVGTVRARELIVEAQMLCGAPAQLARVIATSRPVNFEVNIGELIPVPLLDSQTACNPRQSAKRAELRLGETRTGRQE